MNSLHTLSKSWHCQSWLYEQLAFASEGDAIVLLEDAVLALQSALTLASFQAKCQAMKIELYYLQEDALLRGIDNQCNNIKPITYAELVTLLSEYKKQIAW